MIQQATALKTLFIDEQAAIKNAIERMWAGDNDQMDHPFMVTEQAIGDGTVYVVEPASMYPFDNRERDASTYIVCILAKANKGYMSVRKYRIVSSDNR